MKKENNSFGEETPGATSLTGSLTVEAALVLTLVIFAWTALLTLFSALQIQMELRYAMEQAAEEYAMLAYLTVGGEEGSEPEEGVDVFGLTEFLGDSESQITDFVRGGITQWALRSRILNLVGQDRLEDSCIWGGSQGITLLGSSGLNEAGDIQISLTYLVEIPFLPFPYCNLPITQQVVRHAWVGALEKDDDSEGEDSGEVVYVTDRGRVYHVSETCSHLKLSVQSVSIGEVESLRSRDGSCYYPCERCASHAEPETVYLTEDGDRYHTDISCGSLKRTVEAVKRTETELPACRTCGSGD